MNHTIINLENKLDEITKQYYKLQNQFNNQITDDNSKINDTDDKIEMNKNNEIKNINDSNDIINKHNDKKLNLKDIGSINREVDKMQEYNQSVKDNQLKESNQDEIDKKLGSSLRSDLTSMLNEITKTNSQINKAVDSVSNDLNIVKNLGKINNHYKNQDKSDLDKVSNLSDKYLNNNKSKSNTYNYQASVKSNNSNRTFGR